MAQNKPKTGYYRVEPVEPNVFATASMGEILEQLDSCDYRCEAGPLRLNLAFIELKRRRPRDLQSGDRERLAAVARRARVVLDSIIELGVIPEGPALAALEDALNEARALY